MVTGEADKRAGRWRAAVTRTAAHLLILAAAAGSSLWASVFAPSAVRQPLRKLDLLVYDAWVQRLPGRKPDPRIVIVGMDDASLTHIAGLGRPFYPLPRACHARVVDELRRAGAKVVGFDVMFRDPLPGDAAFAAALRRHGNVVAALAPDTYEAHGTVRPVFVPVAPALRGSLTPASIVVPTDVLERARWLNPYQADPSRPGVRYPHLAFALVAAFFGEAGLAPTVRDDTFTWGRHVSAPLTHDDESVLLRYAGPPGTFGYVPYYEVYDGTWRRTRPAGYFRDKIVLVGAMQPLTDRMDTPVGRDMPGVELLAQAAQMVLHRDYLRPAAPVAAAWAAGGLTVLLLLLLRASGPGFVPVAAVLLGGFWALCAQQALLRTNVWLPTLQPVAGLALGAALVLAYESFHARTVLRRFVPAGAAGRALGAGAVRTRATERVVTVVCCDVRSSAALAEALPKEWMDALMRRWRAAADEAARRHGTERSEHVGDGLLLCFHDDSFLPGRRRGGAPHPVRAVRWAREVLAEAERIHRSGAAGATGFRVGIGIATGPVREGLVAGGRRARATVMGDTVEVASRLRDMTGRLGRPVVMTGASYAGVKDVIVCDPLGPHHVRGRQEPVELYAPAAGDAAWPRIGTAS